MNNRSSSSREPGGSEEKTLAGDLESVRNLRAAKASAPLLDELANDIQALNERDLRAAVVCLVGPTGAGKSTLLNALAGVQVAQEGVDRPTTTTPVVYAPADIDELELGLQVDAKISRYQASADRPWSGHVLIDAPDVNSIRREHRDTVRALAAASDVLVVVLHHQAVVEEITTEFVDGWADRRRVAVVLNRVDQLSTDAAALLLAQVRETASERWGVDPDAVFGVSALRARENEGEDPGFRALVGWLAGLVDAGVVRGIRRTNREGTRRRLATEVGAIADATADDIGLIRSSLAEGWDTFADQANKDVARRLVVRRADVELALGAELAKRWRGPGGILLRIGMWGSVGTLGALALRRNPLAAGAFAVGGQVADKLRSSVAERRLERATGVAPNPDDAAAWIEDAFRQARVSADAVGSELAQGVAAVLGESGDAAIGAVDDGWAELIELDLPEYVASWRMSWFRLPLDLPVYALAIDVGVRTVRSYITGGYLPLDYYVNALALAVVTAGLCYMAGRFAVAVAARSFLRRARRRIAARLHERLTAQASKADVVIDERRQSLQRLST